ncbi:hypothetical protein [Mesorhizobium sp. NPDC059025]|uniref:hypothetical protein n=1 Tax=unclassified Mesorhizobium TaxID=325217 RepID=UPI0036C8C87A
MNRIRSTLRSFLLALCVGGLIAAAPASAMPISSPAYTRQVVTVAADCYAIGQEVAAQNGGTLAKASSANRGGQEVCVIVVLVPGKDGERPRRAEMVVPAG